MNRESMSVEINIDITTRLDAFLREELNVQDYKFSKLDSLSVIRLIMGLENMFGLSIELSEIVDVNFDSLLSLTEFVQRKRKTLA